MIKLIPEIWSSIRCSKVFIDARWIFFIDKSVRWSIRTRTT